MLDLPALSDHADALVTTDETPACPKYDPLIVHDYLAPGRHMIAPIHYSNGDQFQKVFLIHYYFSCTTMIDIVIINILKYVWCQ